MSCNYSKLRGKIREHYGTQEKFALALGIGKVSLSKRLTGKADFTLTEIQKSVDLLFIPKEAIADYFFNQKA